MLIKKKNFFKKNAKKFNASEIKEIRNFVKNNLEFLKQKWNEYFNN